MIIFQKRRATSNALAFIADYNVVVGFTDHFPKHYVLNDACVLANKPLVYVSIFGYEGQFSVFNDHKNLK
jgi:sulfur-carrier protein adenylyltransferase/sulfurtransferase